MRPIFPNFIRNKKASCLSQLIVGFLIAAAVTAYLNPSFREYLLSRVDAQWPGTKVKARKGIAKATAISQDVAAKIKDYSQFSIKKGTEYFHSFRLNLAEKKPFEGIGQVLAPNRADQIKVCSFNIRIFSDKSRNDEGLENIAQILKHYDLVAIQELRDEKVLKRTIKILNDMGQEFNYEISPPVGRGVHERYAFLYRPDKVQIKTKGKLYPDRDDKFIREPFYASFEAGNFDFILMTVHVLFGDFEEERRRETAELAKAYKQVQKENPSEKDIILLGDFNLPPIDHGWADLKLLPSMAYLIGPPEKTTITDTSLYDNFWFQKDHVLEYSGRSGVVRFDENVFRNDDEKAKLAISDHRPIWADFQTNISDDD